MAYRNVVVAAADHSTNDSVRHGRALAESFGSNFVVVMTDRQPADFATDGFEIVTRQGDLSEVALDEANVRNARLIAIDAGFARRMHPTAAERVVRRASCSVLVTRPDFGLRVAVATDLSVPSVPAIVAGVQEAKRRDVPITVVHCVDTRAAIAQATAAMARRHTIAKASPAIARGVCRMIAPTTKKGRGQKSSG